MAHQLPPGGQPLSPHRPGVSDALRPAETAAVPAAAGGSGAQGLHGSGGRGFQLGQGGKCMEATLSVRTIEAPVTVFMTCLLTPI